MVARLYIVAVRQFLQRSATRVAFDGLFLLFRVRDGGRSICFPCALARVLPSAVRARIRSRNIAKVRVPPARWPVLLVLSAGPRSAKNRNGAFASTIRLTVPNKSKVLRARRSLIALLS
jgi:hypothetical protein